MASRRLDDLAPELRDLAQIWKNRCIDEGIPVLIYCTWRSNEEQAILWSYGRTKPGKKVTDAKPGQSKHNCVNDDGAPAARAFDFCPFINGKCVWDRKTKEQRRLWDRAVAIGEELGLESGKNFPSKDWPHLQLGETDA